MVEQIFQWGGIIITAIFTAISLIASILQAIKTKKYEKLIKLAKVVQKIPEFICEAEEILGNGNGQAKLSYVLDKINIKCLQAGIEFNEDALKVEIENILKTPQKKE